MNTMNKNGISVCPRGEERYTYFNLTPRRRTKSRYCQYDYRHTNGKLFSTVAPTLEKCREKRYQWLKTQAQNTPDPPPNYTCLFYVPANYAVCATCAIGGYCHQGCEKFQPK